MKHGKTAVVVAWRKGETELEETIESASRSLRKGDVVIPVEDVTGAGPARTRHRGILAAQESGSDVAIIVDAHMRFDGKVLSRMAREIRADGAGLLCAMCHHNEDCSFDGAHKSGASYYAGADIHYMGEDQNGPQSLVWKWSSDSNPGPRACIGGACYVFPVAWYFAVGQPLSALPAWGCDEEALSISAWLSGVQPTVFDGHVAHRWRARPPWDKAERPILDSRASLISAVVHDTRDIEQLCRHQRCCAYESAETARWREALHKLDRTWAQWKATVPVMPKARPRPPRANYSADETARRCQQCGSPDSTVEKTRMTGRLVIRYRICSQCGRRRTTRDICPTV